MPELVAFVVLVWFAIALQVLIAGLLSEVWTDGSDL